MYRWQLHLTWKVAFLLFSSIFGENTGIYRNLPFFIFIVLLFHCLLLPQFERKEQSIAENNTILLLTGNTQFIQTDSPFYIVLFCSTTIDLKIWLTIPLINT